MTRDGKKDKVKQKKRNFERKEEKERTCHMVYKYSVQEAKDTVMWIGKF
jgi:hypothetical protein